MDAEGGWERAWCVLDPFQQLLRIWSDDDFKPSGEEVTRILRAKLLLRDCNIQDLSPNPADNHHVDPKVFVVLVCGVA